jgi:prolyl oligopeptidase
VQSLVENAVVDSRLDAGRVCLMPVASDFFIIPPKTRHPHYHYPAAAWASRRQFCHPDHAHSCLIQPMKSMDLKTITMTMVMAFGALDVAAATGVTETKSCPAAAAAGVTYGVAYPVSNKGAQIDDYHGVKVADPYRWLEDANSAETRAWVDSQNKLTQGFLSQIPARDAIRQRLTALWNFERFGIPIKQGHRIVFARNDGLQNQSVLYTLTNVNDTPRLLLDPNTLSADGTVALAGTEISPDGKYLAYATAASGSDWNEWKVRDIDSGKDLDDRLQWVKFSKASWTRDSKGFYYSRYDAPKESTKLADINYFQKLYFHRVGTAQSSDVLVYDRPDQKEWSFDAKVSDDGHYLVINIGQGTERKNRIYLKDLRTPDAPVVAMLDGFDATYEFIGNDGPVLRFRTDKDAPRGRVIAIDSRKPASADWKVIIPQAAQTLQAVHAADNRLIVSYLADAHSQVKVFDLRGKLVRTVDLPGIGSVAGFEGKPNDREVFYSYTSFTTPQSIYHYDVQTGKSSLFRQPKVDFDPATFETRQVFVPSKDGTKVPLFIVAKKGMKLDGNNPTYLFGYGGFNVSLTPSFSVPNLAWMEMGGVFVLANLRGGGEYGQEWHQAGTKLHKQNVFDDFIGAAEWLIANKVTSPAKLAIGGGSNGGLLVGATLAQRPELFAAALPAVGVMDMLRFHKFTIGWGWISDYGTSDNADEFKALYAYSPLHNLKRGACYPATLITTADHDDRVVPAHSFKFAATEQAAQGGAAPVLIRIDVKAGHGAGKPVSKQIEEVTDRWSFLSKILEMPGALAPAVKAAGGALPSAGS